MLLEFNKKDFQKGLNLGSSLCGKSKVMPILEYVKVEVHDDGKVYICSCDRENYIKVFVGNNLSPYNDPNFDFCVLGSDFKSYISAIGSEIIKIEIENIESPYCNIIHDNGRAEIPILKVSEFPAFSCDKMESQCVVNSEVLYNWIKRGINFTADDELRPVMNGMFLYGKDGILGYCCTDAHLLINEEISFNNIDDINVIINKKVFNSVCSLLSLEEYCTIKISEKNTEFIVGDSSVISSNIEGKFPNFRAVIPVTDGIDPVIVSKNEIISCLNRNRILSNQVSKLVVMDIDKNTMTLESKDIDFSKSNFEKLMCECNGVKHIGLNIDKFIDVLSSCNSDNVLIYINGSNKPIVVKEENNNDKTLILMPMIITGE